MGTKSQMGREKGTYGRPGRSWHLYRLAADATRLRSCWNVHHLTLQRSLLLRLRERTDALGLVLRRSVVVRRRREGSAGLRREEG